ncbi:MAG: HAMP domain-containing sensor histidine kinase, partial [Ilumatobacteraceae bacterium]
GVTEVILAAHDIPLASYLRTVERERVVAGLERDAFLLGSSAEQVLTGESAVEDLQTTIDVYAARTGAEVVVTDTAGTAIAVTGAPDRVGTSYANRPEIATAATGAPTSGERYSATLDGSLVYVAVPARSGVDVVGVVRVSYPAAVIDDRAGDKVRGLVTVAIISLIGAAVAAVFVASTVTGPLSRLERSTDTVAAGDLTTRADEHDGPPEVRRLARSFNTMTTQVDELLQQQRSFAGDASHQLRTPLTGLRLQLERAGELLDRDVEAARARIEAAGEETERLQRLVEGLLLLARSERSNVVAASVDVSATVTERVETWAPLADERGIAIRCAVQPGVHALAVPDALEQIIDNLLDNAISVVPDNSTIDVAVVGPISSSPFGCVVTVADRGPGMTDEQLAHAFDRFWRASDAPHAGSGLGLAIVDHLARAGGGSVSLSRRDGGGLVATLNLSVG